MNVLNTDGLVTNYTYYLNNPNDRFGRIITVNNIDFLNYIAKTYITNFVGLEGIKSYFEPKFFEDTIYDEYCLFTHSSSAQRSIYCKEKIISKKASSEENKPIYIFNLQNKDLAEVCFNIVDWLEGDFGKISSDMLLSLVAATSSNFPDVNKHEFNRTYCNSRIAPNNNPHYRRYTSEVLCMKTKDGEDTITWLEFNRYNGNHCKYHLLFRFV